MEASVIYSLTIFVDTLYSAGLRQVFVSRDVGGKEYFIRTCVTSRDTDWAASVWCFCPRVLGTGKLCMCAKGSKLSFIH